MFSPAVALPESRLPEEPRRELRRGTTGIDLEVDGLSVRVGDVPLYRRADDGRLLQCVRVVLRSDRERGRARIAIASGAGADDATAAIACGETVVRLFVPEVQGPEPGRMRVEGEGGLQLEQALELRPQRKWRIFLIHHSHLDVGYTDRQARVLAHHLAYLDSVLDLADATDGWPEPARFRWNVEANWPLGLWLAARPAPARERLLELVLQGRVEVCASPFTFHLEALSVDELAHQLLFADDLRERHRVPVVTAMQTDVPGAPAGLPGLLAAAGVRYLDVAHNWAGRAAPYLTGGERLSRPFRWRSANGRDVLVWHTDSPHGLAYLEGNLLGLADSYEATLELLPEYLAALATRPYPYGEASEPLGLPSGLSIARDPYPYDLLHLRVQGAFADNAGPGLAPAEITRAWNGQWAYPELRLATNREFFESVEERLGDRLETHEGDWTDWWADGLGSAARALARNRRAQATVRTAQTLHVLADQLEGVPDAAWPAELERVHTSMALFDEHTWGAAHPAGADLEGRESGASQWEAKAALAADADDRSTALLDGAAGRVAHLVARVPDASATIVVVNPSSWVRSDLVRVFVPSSRLAPGSRLSIVDAASGERAPHVASPQGGSSARNRPQGTWLAFVAREVPALGYRCYGLVESRAVDEPDHGDPEPAVLENEHYLVEVDPAQGSVARLVDKKLSRDLVDASGPFRFAQYVYERYTSLLRATQRLPSHGGPDAGGPGSGAGAREGLLGSRTCAGYGVVVERIADAVEDRVALRLVADGVDHLQTTFRLVRGLRRLDVAMRLAKVATAEKESVLVAFPFALERPDVEYELAAAVGSPDRLLPGAARHMCAVRHWVTLEDATATVAWGTRDAPLVQVGGIALPYPPYPETVEPRPGTLVSWAMNNVWDTNFPLRQGGEAELAYSISSGPPSAGGRELGMQVGAAVARPLVGILASPRGLRAALAASGSFCTVDRPDVEIVTLAPSRSGHDFVVHLQSCASEACEVTIAFPDLPVERVWAGSFLEHDLRDVTNGGVVRLSISSGDYLALAVDLDRA